jgi:hypothetical protein
MYSAIFLPRCRWKKIVKSRQGCQIKLISSQIFDSEVAGEACHLNSISI